MSILSISQRSATRRSHGSAVPWRTVLLFGTVLAFANGFWMMSLRHAIGSSWRVLHPFHSWWQESALLVPVFVLAVLAAFTVATRLFGSQPSTLRQVLATILLVTGFATLAGLAVTAISSAYDYHIQAGEIPVMNVMRGLACTSPCVAAQEHTLLMVFVRGIASVARWLLLTNLVLATWLVAARGGRVNVAIGETADGRPAEAPTSRIPDLRLALAGSLAAAAGVQAALVPGQLSDWPAVGALLLVLVVGEVAIAGLLLSGLDGRGVLVLALAVSGIPLALWLWSRTTGLPFGPSAGHARTLRMPDAAAALLQATALCAAATLLRRPAWTGRPAWSDHSRSLVAIALLCLAVIGVATAGLTWFDVFTVHVADLTVTHVH